MHLALRRTAIIVASSAVVLAGAPLLEHAFAAALTQSSFTVDGSSTTTAKDSKPTIAATYVDGSTNATLDAASSTITVTKSGTTFDCPQVVSGNQISCKPSGLLKAGIYNVAIHAVETAPTAGQTVDNNTNTFTVDVPTRSATNTSPGENTRVPSFSNVVVNFNEAIDNSHSTISVQQIADRQPDGSYAPASHTPLTPASGSPDFPNDGKTLTMQPNNTATEIRFTPSSPVVNKGIYRVTVDVFGTNNDAGQNTAATENPKAETQDSYTFVMDDTPLPPPPGATNLDASPNPVTFANEASVTFSGKAMPGDTITIDVFDGTTHINNAGSANGGPVPVPTCPSSPTSCGWSKAFNLTSLKDGTLTWTATETAPAGSPTSTGSTSENGPSLTKDATPPANAHVAGSFTPSNSTTLHVTGGSDSTVDHYTLDIHDAASPSHTIPQITLDKTSGGGVASDGTFVRDVDVSSLDDGTITMAIVAYDALGNHTAIPATGTATSTATKAVGLLLDFNSSFFKQSNSDTPSFPAVLARPHHDVQQLSQLAVKFSNPIQLTIKDNGTVHPQDTNAADPLFVEVLPNGDGNTFVGTRSIDPNDGRTLLVTPPAGLADGTYKVKVQAFQQGKCPDYNSDPVPVGTGSVPNCPSQWNYNDWIKVPNTTDPFTFTVDTQPPTAPTISTIPAGTIDGSNVGDVIIKGAGEAGSMVTLTAKSSGGGSVLALNQGQPVTVGDNGNWSDEETSSALAVLPDGTVTITATPTDAAGNTGTAGTGTVTLAARPSIPRALAVSTTDSSFTLHWTAPSYDGYPAVNGNAISHLTGYTYTYTDTTNGAADPTTHSVSVTNPNATSATQAGLLPGHTYAVTLCAVNDISGPCNNVNTTANPAFATALTAKVSKALVVYGNPITLSGRLTRTDIGAGLASQPLTITPRFDNGALGAVIHLTTDSLGNWKATLTKPSKNALYLVSFNATHADPNYQPSNSSVRSLVAVALRIDKVTSRSTSHLYAVTIAGHITPNQSGRSVSIFARAAGATHYQRIGTAKISSKSTWAFAKTFGKGKFYLYASFPSQNGNVGGKSQTVTFTRS
jgi:hypothetical protein